MGGGKKPTIGYKYFMGLHIGVCGGPVNSFLKLRAGQRTAWSGNATSSSRVWVYKPNLFGGDDKEGGLMGWLDIAFGEPTQGVNSYLQAKQGAQQPAYRRLLSLIWNGGEVTSITPYIKTWTMQVMRTTAGWSTPVWYDTKAAINMLCEADIYDDSAYFAGGGGTQDVNDPDFNPNDPGLSGFNFEQTTTVVTMNPAHIVYQAITDTIWGMGYPVSSINDASFRAAADTLYAEGFGLCLTWSRQDSVESFIQTILDTIGAVLVIDPTSGLFLLKLIRNDYNVTTGMQGSTPLVVFDEDKTISIEQFQRMSPVNLISEVTVTYVNANTGKTHNVTTQNLGMIQSVTGIVSSSKTYVGVCNRVMADRLAQRDLNAMGTPLAQLKMSVGRWAYKLTPGDVILFSNQKLGVERVAFRIGDIDYGKITDGTITITAVEDVFGLPDASYLGQQQSQWLQLDPTPQAVTKSIMFELPYREIYRLAPTTVSGTVSIDPAACYAGFGASRPTSLSINYDLMIGLTASGYGTFDLAGTMDWTPAGKLAVALDYATSSTLVLKDFDVLSSVAVGTACLVGTEICKVTNIDNAGSGSVVVSRGCLDTYPTPWPVDTLVFFYEENLGGSLTSYPQSENVRARLLTRTSTGVLDFNAAGQLNITMAGRQVKPNPPKQVQVNGAYYPVTFSGDYKLSWASRNRLTEADQLVDFTAAGITGEAGQTFDLQLYDENNVQKKYYGAVSVVSQIWTTEVADSANTLANLTYFDSAMVENPLKDSFELGYTILPFTGDTWLTSSTSPHSGNVCFRAKAIGNGGSTSVSLALPSAGTLKFWYRPSSENSWDKMVVTVGGTTVLTTSGTVTPWTYFEYAVASATTVVFTYSKDGSSASGDDTVYIDDFEFVRSGYTYTPAALVLPTVKRVNGKVRARLQSRIGSVYCTQAFDYTCYRAGYTFSYGTRYGS